MEASKVPGYSFYKTYLYSSHKLPGAGDGPWGVAEIVINGAKGMLTCQTTECLNRLREADPEIKFFAAVIEESNRAKLCTGELNLDAGGCGRYNWEFSTAHSEAEKYAGSTFNYQIHVVAGQAGTSYLEEGAVLVRGLFSLPFKVRDSRIVGFKKEGTAKKPSREAWEKNPLIQRVEPFEPPISNSVWWQISIQPDYRNFQQTQFCPRQKSYKAVF